MGAGPGGGALLSLDGVTRRYGGVCAVDAVSLEVAPGERHVVIGPNGAGKTTLFKLISRLEPLSDGRIEMFGRDVSRMSAHKVARLGLARTYQITQVFPRLRVIENVMLAVLGSRPRKFRMLRSAMGDADAVRKAEETLERVGLGGLGGTLAAELGHGQQRQLEVGLALAGEPKLLLLDEPAAGLSGADRGAVRDLVAGLPEDITVLLIEHDMELALGLADRVTCLHNGATVA
ncbi:MAG: ABC transporter ATP-binding protein, partial [Actinomycetota bacterium]|nr:ABC transporter ATP-binding protein [Actinomycetota bacterium]